MTLNERTIKDLETRLATNLRIKSKSPVTVRRIASLQAQIAALKAVTPEQEAAYKAAILARIHAMEV